VLSTPKYSHAYLLFEKLYVRHAPKILGFLSMYTQTKPQAEEYLIIIFCKVWADINDLGSNEENKIIRIVLSVCKPILKNKKPFHLQN
jgi:hypothetical protein